MYAAANENAGAMPEVAIKICYKACQASFEDLKANKLGQFVGNFEALSSGQQTQE
jgi:hypothetical protein